MEISSQRDRASWLLPVLCVSAFMANLDLFIVNVAFGAIGRTFSGSSLAHLSWVLNVYAILYAALLVPLGRLSDRFGQKAGFLAGLALFTVGSAACAVAPGLWALVAFRGVQAVGAAAMTPTSLGLLLTATPAPRRVRAVRIWAATGGLAAAAGPVAGGLLVEASWRWVFLVNVPIGVAPLLLAVRCLPDTRHDRAATWPDLLGGVIAVIAIGSLALALVQGSSWGWSSGKVIAALAVAVAGTALFRYRSLRHPAPVVEPALLRVRTFRWSNLTALAFNSAFAAGLLANILWLQDVWHYSALRTGLAVAPGPLMVPLFAAVGQRLARRIGAGWTTALGSTLFAAGTVLLILSLGERSHYVAEALPGWLVTGVAVGLALPTILSSATVDLPAARSATGSAVVNMARQIGTVLGVSTLIALVGPAHGYPALHTAFTEARWLVAGLALLGALTAIRMNTAPPAPPGHHEPRTAPVRRAAGVE
ncbi:MFS transporter [Streptantibioticus silvisoli]|uniref:MFS transporter n=1 Tax=Streptantibioticus silvisoli TaxID=2705255 RepID=A0ABT6W118_9ACTN|nr:MFS transporter [Streptantibioticus silvisoli]MDI5964440.1 MFS transporter [Streptantibioticus silvisoli]